LSLQVQLITLKSCVQYDLLCVEHCTYSLAFKDPVA